MQVSEESITRAEQAEALFYFARCFDPEGNKIVSFSDAEPLCMDPGAPITRYTPTPTRTGLVLV